MEFTAYLRQCEATVNQQLIHFLPPDTDKTIPLIAAMHYACLNGGKRIRPLLVYATGEALDVPTDHLHAAAVAIELIHTYSLIHDDLPAMDDDALRRGRPTCHIAFDEATAILAGDALQTLAFEVLARETEPSYLTPAQRLSMVHCLAKASGALGMAGGQSLDMAVTGKQDVTLSVLMRLHTLKTGALLAAAVELAVLAAPQATSEIKNALQQYAHCLGLAFQIQDDILDVEGTVETIGKPVGSDARLGKNTFPELIGMQAAKAKLVELQQSAVTALGKLGDKAECLHAIMAYVITRAA